MKYTKKLLTEAVSNSISVAGVLRYLKLKQAGGTHSHIAKRIKFFNIDTTHFLGKRANSGSRHKGGSKKKTAKDILKKRKDGSRGKRHQLVRALLEVGETYNCKECGLGDKWNKKTITLQVDHINGDWLDDRKQRHLGR